MERNIRTCVITGVAGMIGANLAHWILEHHPEVQIVGIDDLSGGYRDNIPAGVIFYKLDLSTNSSLLEDIFAIHKPDVVFHFAAYAAEGLSGFIRRYNYINNLVVTAGIVNCCIKYDVKRLVFTSSMAVYGNSDGNLPFSENSPCSPIDSYGVAKHACEVDIQIAGEQHGLDWCIIRPHNVYGANQNIFDSYRNVLGIWMYKLLHDQPLTIYGDGLQERAFSYIDDSLECFWKAGFDSKCSKEIINLGGIHNTTILEAANTLIDVAGFGTIEHLAPRHEVKYAYSTHQKSVNLLGFEHKTNLHEGLTKMWAWAKEQPDRPRFVWEKYELDKGLYPYWQQDALKSNSKSVKLL